MWECTETLGNFLTQHIDIFEQARVLDLGCGSGILGILALQHGASVHFQDYVSSESSDETFTFLSPRLVYFSGKAISI